MKRFRLAYFSPLPPARSGIADYSTELLRGLARVADITLFVVDPDAVADDLRRQYSVAAIESYGARRFEFDLPLYHIGNNAAYHEEIYLTLLRYPGVLVLHECDLYQFMVHRSLGLHDHIHELARDLGLSQGMRGYHRAQSIAAGEYDLANLRWPLFDRAVRTSLGTIVHSEYARKRILHCVPEACVVHIPHIVDSHPRASDVRLDLGWPKDAIIFASLGHSARYKQLHLSMRAFAQLQAEFPEVRYLLVGESSDDSVELLRLVAELGLSDSVQHLDFVPDFQAFVDCIAACDIVVNLRDPTMGETSGSALRALSAGRPLIVFDHGWYSELPDEVAVKVDVMDEKGLLDAMRQLARGTARRLEMGEMAESYVRCAHQAESVSARYMEFLYEIVAAPESSPS